MRLISVDTLELVDFSGKDIPPYAILSHRWTDDEPTFKEFRKGLKTDSAGYRKILGFRDAVKRLHPGYVKFIWVDTVCIDKRSSAELTESINSMYSYYRDSFRCFVHLQNVSDPTPDVDFMAQFRHSSWWTRGWTLQELLAPYHVIFFTNTWQIIGSKIEGSMPHRDAISVLDSRKLSSEISRITKIPLRVLQLEVQPRQCSIAERMSWASERQTSRLEDLAYCLLGLFDINMPLIYGEGIKAFSRLQLEIIKVSHDRSIFAWASSRAVPGLACLANGPWNYRKSSGIVKWPGSVVPYTVKNQGLKLSGVCMVINATIPRSNRSSSVYIFPLTGFRHRKCPDSVYYMVMIRLQCGHFGRIFNDRLVWSPPKAMEQIGKYYIHISGCEDSDDVMNEYWEHGVFWQGEAGRRILSEHGIETPYEGG